MNKKICVRSRDADKTIGKYDHSHEYKDWDRQLFESTYWKIRMPGRDADKTIGKYAHSHEYKDRDKQCLKSI